MGKSKKDPGWIEGSRPTRRRQTEQGKRKRRDPAPEHQIVINFSFYYYVSLDPLAGSAAAKTLARPDSAEHHFVK
jgi:hypothetical protein